MNSTLKVDVGEKLVVSFPYKPGIVEKIRTIPGRRFDKQRKVWIIPFSGLKTLIEMFGLSEKNFSQKAKKYWEYYKNTVLARQISPHRFKFPFRTRPYKHQLEAFYRACHFYSFALFLEMGLGKTKVAIDTVAYRYICKQIDKALVICPKSIIETWKEEIIKHCPLVVTPYRILLIKGTASKKLELLKKWLLTRELAFAIMNYESLIIPSVKDFLVKAMDEKIMLIFDESTKIKSPSAKRTKVAMKLAEKTLFRLILTGSPITNSWEDIYTQWYIIDLGENFGHSFYEFRNRYFYPDSNGWRWYLKEGKEKEIKEVIQSQSIIIKKEDAIDLPSKVYEKMYVDLTEEQQKAYTELKRHFITEVEGKEITAAFILPRLLKLSEICNGFIIDEEGNVTEFPSNPKLEILKELLEDILPHKKVVIWSRFRYTIYQICQRFKEYNPVALYGDTSKNAQEIVKRFQEDPTCRIFVGNPRAGGLGITLTATDTAIYINNSFSLEERIQSEDRIHRIGSERYNKCLYIDIVAKETIEEDILKALASKKEIVEYIREKGWKNILKGEV